ncbi:carbohydrate ABC transporter permease [Thermogemmatispora carboxidivorans]|uniref:carbohydrate ABC transporter permease n=1 Tax=Thermogemmatispora carboxidivorans TaxID=1382306 RepID=UPI00069A1911|nr:carbohydrate ABC transporter permease [Thermogemmatispora carboxidivorans]
MARIGSLPAGGSVTATRQTPARAVGRRSGWTLRGLVLLFLVLVLIYFVIPLFWLVVSATKTNDELFSTFGLWFAPDFHLLQNLHDVFTYDDGIFVTWLTNSAYYAVVSALGASLIATLAGYAFAKLPFPGRELVFAIILGTIMVPNTALAIPTYLLLSKVGLVNTPLAIILPSLVTPFGVYLMRVYAEQALPDDLLDAARVDGASEWRIFWRIALRLLAPGFVTVLLLTFVGTWNNFFLPLVVTNNPAYYPLTVGLANWNQLSQAFSGSRILYTLVITGSLISVFPLIIGFLFLQRYWQGGLTFGSLRS